MKTITPQVKAEYHRPTDILLHEPGDELYYGLMHYESNDYLGPFDRFKAKKEHRAFAKLMKSKGIGIHYLTDLLLSDTIDENDVAVEGMALEQLRGFAKECLRYSYHSNLLSGEKERLEDDRGKTIAALNPRDLVKIIIERPAYGFKKHVDEIESGLKFEAQANLCYTRDQQIITDKGIVIGKLKNDARKYENEIIKFAYKKTGMPILYEIKGKDSLEGGDYIPLGSFALIGQGLRTTRGAIDQLLENNVFGFDEIVVVEDPFKKMEQMHLDTYFNIIGEKKAIILDVRYNDGLRPGIRVYKRTENGSYKYEPRENSDFIEFLTKEKGFELKTVKYCAEKNFNVNVLSIGDNEIIGVDGICKDYQPFFYNNGVKANLLDFSNMMMAYGGPHCLTQVMRRVGDNDGK